jgi:segregation and condensation protein A
MGDFMTYQVKTEVFEGPLDLLLHLIKKMEIDIYDIPMAQITEQYLLYIQSLSDPKLDEAGEYFVMAATLLSIKSKMLLPKQAEETEDEESPGEEDPRSELVEQLIEYKKYKEAAELFKVKEQERNLIFTKPPIDFSRFAPDPAPVGQEGGVTVLDMLAAYQKLLKRKRIKKPMSAKITIRKVTVEEKMKEVLDAIIKSNKRVTFRHFFHHEDRHGMIVTFLAVLELIKNNHIDAEQSGNFQEIYLKAKEEIVLESS